MTPSIVYLLLKLNELVSKFLDAPFYNSVECCILLLWNPLAPHLFSMNFQKSLLKVLHLLLLALLAISDAVIQSCGFINTSPGILFIFPLICLWFSQIVGRIQALQFFFFLLLFSIWLQKGSTIGKETSVSQRRSSGLGSGNQLSPGRLLPAGQLLCVWLQPTHWPESMRIILL